MAKPKPEPAARSLAGRRTGRGDRGSAGTGRWGREAGDCRRTWDKRLATRTDVGRSR